MIAKRSEFFGGTGIAKTFLAALPAPPPEESHRRNTAEFGQYEFVVVTIPVGPLPRYPLRDRDKILGKDFVDQVKAIGIKKVFSAPRAPWQRAYVERLIGTIRRECLDHVIVFTSVA